MLEVGYAGPEVLRPEQVGHPGQEPLRVGEGEHEDVGVPERLLQLRGREAGAPRARLPEAGRRGEHPGVVDERLRGHGGDVQPSGRDALQLGDGGVLGIHEEEEVQRVGQVGHGLILHNRSIDAGRPACLQWSGGRERYVMHWTEKRLGGWALLIGTAAAGLGYALSPGRGAVDTVPSTSLSDLTLAMARNEALSYTVPIVIIVGALLMLHGLLTLRRYAAPVPRLGLLALVIALALQMVMRGFDYMITGLGAGALESGGGAVGGAAAVGAGAAAGGVGVPLHLRRRRLSPGRR